MGGIGKMFDRYDDTVKVKGGRKDFPTCTVLAICDRFQAFKTDDDEPRTYLKSFWTIMSVERGEVDAGDQKTIPYFKHKKHKFFERDTKAAAACFMGLTGEEADALKKAEIARILEEEAPGRVLRLRCVRKEPTESKAEDGKKRNGFTNVEYVGLIDLEEIRATLDKKQIKTFFPKGLDEEGRGIGFGEVPDEEAEVENENESEEDEDEAPRKKAKKPARKAVDESDDGED